MFQASSSSLYTTAFTHTSDFGLNADLPGMLDTTVDCRFQVTALLLVQYEIRKSRWGRSNISFTNMWYTLPNLTTWPVSKPELLALDKTSGWSALITGPLCSEIIFKILVPVFLVFTFPVSTALV